MNDPLAPFLPAELMRLHPITQNSALPALHIKGDEKVPMGANEG